MKKGFTLIELLCVIVIIAIISLITFPRVTKYIDNSKKELYVTQVKNIEKQAEKWALNNMDKLDKYHINNTYITLDLLKGTKYLEKENILNPKNKKVMNGCVLISYITNEYTYEYIDDCSAKELTEPYIKYDYDFDKIGNEAIVKTDKSVTPAYQTILNNNENVIHVLGETTDGLYDLENEYVFRGNDVNNYVKYENKEWRILSIDKKDYSMKLISTTTDSSTMSSDLETDFTKTTLQNTLSDKVKDYSKLVDTWDNGIVADSDSSLTNLESMLKINTVTSKVGLLSLYDYAIASTDNNCESSFKSLNCKNNNYLATTFTNKSFWTMNTDGNKFWYVDSNDGVKLTESTSGPYYYATVIKVPINVYCTNSDTATGSSSTFAYNFK